MFLTIGKVFFFVKVVAVITRKVVVVVRVKDSKHKSMCIN
jgi:hypothetical protein